MVAAEERLAMMQQQPQLDQVVTMLDTAKEMLEPGPQHHHQQPGNNVSMQTEIRYGSNIFLSFRYFLGVQIFLPFPLSVQGDAARL